MGKLSVHDLVEVVTGETILFKIDIGALKNIRESDIDPSLCRCNVSHLSLEEVQDGLVVPEATLEEETLGQTTKPVLVELSVR